MECPQCSKPSRKNGFTKCGTQRFRCDCCRTSFSAEKDSPLGVMRLPMEKAEMVLKLLLEGCSVRSTQRLTGVSKRAILALMVQVGENCKRMLEAKLKDVVVADVQADEIWSFVGCKERVRAAKNYPQDMGDAYCFVGIERHTKLIVAWHLGKRTMPDTYAFAGATKRATAGHFQMTTDGFAPYKQAIPDTLGSRVDFSMLVKKYGVEGVEEQRRYSPAKIVSIDYQPISGQPCYTEACTSHVERSNLSLRMSVRRYTGLTNGFSKKWENHEMMLALWFAHYNFSRKHMTLKETPAMASGLEDHVWTIRELITESAKF